MDPTTTRPSAVFGGSGGRDDCWSEGATAVLINAWGERHLRCNRGHLRQSDWNEVTSAVNNRLTAAGKPPSRRRSDVQCKNRIDTLKKKYKVEKSKPPPSSWPFFCKLDFLISNPNPNINPNPNPNINPNPNPRVRVLQAESSESSFDDDVESGEEEEEEEEDGREAVRELAVAIARFGEVYERVESTKLEQVMELERQRMEFVKEIEFQRMNMVVDAQLELERLKKRRWNANAVGDTTGEGFDLGSLLFLV